jgi:hypothetical protein
MLTYGLLYWILMLRGKTIYNLSGFSDIRIAIKNVLPALDHCSDLSSPLELKLMKQVEITAVAMHLQSHVCMSFTNRAMNGLVAPIPGLPLCTRPNTKSLPRANSASR